MQVSSYMTDFMNFKDEIYKKVRLLESKLISEINTKFGKLNTDYQKLDNKLTFINENTDSLLEFIATQKSNSDKIVDLELFKNKAEQNIISHDMKIKNLSAEIEKIKTRYDKLFHENLDVPGYIGPGCQFKTISEYIQNYILEFSILKNEKEKIKIENVEVKNKLDNILKSTLNLIDSSIIRSQNYSDNKHEDMKNILNTRLFEINEKNMELRTQINKLEIQNDNQIQNIKNDVDKLYLMKNQLINLTDLTDQKIEQMNNKLTKINEEIELLKIGKKEIDNNNNLKTKKNDNMNRNVYINSKRSNFKLQKTIPMQFNDNNLEQSKNQINYINEIKKQKNNKEEKKLNNSEDEYEYISSQNFEKIVPRNLNNIDENYNSKKKLNEDKKEKEEKKILNHISNYFKNKTNNEKNTERKEKNNISSPIMQQSLRNEDISSSNINSNNLNNNKNINYYSNNNNIDQIIKDSVNLYKNKKIISNKTKIKIDSLEKQKIIHSNSSENITIHSNNMQKEKENKLYNIKNNNNFNIQNFAKINNNYTKKINKDELKKSNTPRIIKFYENNKKSNYKKSNSIIYRNTIEQNKIIKEIKTFYNNKKEKSEQQSLRNKIDCNIINLHLEKPLNDNNINVSTYNLNSHDTKLRNNLNDIRMKINPAFGRTTYSFYNKGDLNKDYINDKSFDKKLNKLKDKLNVAFVSSINHKIILNDKGINPH